MKKENINSLQRSQLHIIMLLSFGNELCISSNKMRAAELLFIEIGNVKIHYQQLFKKKTLSQMLAREMRKKIFYSTTKDIVCLFNHLGSLLKVYF